MYCARMATDTIVLTVSREAAERVAEAWESDQLEVPFVIAVRDMLAGQDGFLHKLNEALGRNPYDGDPSALY